jgi:hypothetical protein
MFTDPMGRNMDSVLALLKVVPITVIPVDAGPEWAYATSPSPQSGNDAKCLYVISNEYDRSFSTPS